MNIFGIGIPEIAVIVVLALLIFGPKRLPQLGKTIGKTLKGLQTASKEFENEINKTLKLNENDE
ncbi:TatA/E family twin arginine-targeting protein translocase [Prochlorococcus sp. AH-736-M13]|jgi:sec-independent protein translocase protein TatA|nr:TatA/E family twin arginine-targeting protein translocase [Prochlorococcus sp. AH-736-M13]MDA9747478.1 TatA/E family twin arginine-targeting protein translocase [Prochlorococcus sp. AH-736-M13]